MKLHLVGDTNKPCMLCNYDGYKGSNVFQKTTRINHHYSNDYMITMYICNHCISNMQREHCIGIRQPKQKRVY